MKIVTVVGARPQFIKAAAVSRVIRSEYAGRVDEVLVHTGQHYDENMSKVFFEELNIPEPKYNLEISGGTHGKMTGRMLEAVESVLLQEKPDWLLVYGDTNSTLAGTLAASKLHIPVAHVEAGLRSFNMRMPEEINRILTDRVSSLLFCPTAAAVENLRLEGLTTGISLVGDVMYDVALYYREQARLQSDVLRRFDLSPGGFALATCHRAENTDSRTRLESILSSLAEISRQVKVVFPLHPRTRKLISDYGLSHLLAPLLVTEPISFLDMVALEQAAQVILSDSGGVQKEAYFYQVPCITLREETEWVETVAAGWNTLVGASQEKIISAYSNLQRPEQSNVSLYGDGHSAAQIVNQLCLSR